MATPVLVLAVAGHGAHLTPAQAESARARHARYKPDEGARDRAARLAREKYPWANAASEATVLYSLHREGAFTGDLRAGTRVEVPGLAGNPPAR